MMLARVADSLYWIGRYVERAEHQARLADVMHTAALDEDDTAIEVARRAALAGAPAGGEAAGDAALDLARRLVLDVAADTSVVASLARARENARQVRDQITTETWERLNLVHLRMTSGHARRAYNADPAAYVRGLIADLHHFHGAVDTTLSHGEGWRFLLVGLYLERSQSIARLLHACFEEPAAALDDVMTQMAVLRMACALEPYLRAYTADVDSRRMLEFLLFDAEFPRSVRFSTRRMEEHLTRLAPAGSMAADRSRPERLAARLCGRLEFADMDEGLAPGRLLGLVARECAAIHEAIQETFVRYPVEQRLPA